MLVCGAVYCTVPERDVELGMPAGRASPSAGSNSPKHASLQSKAPPAGGSQLTKQQKGPTPGAVRLTLDRPCFSEGRQRAQRSHTNAAPADGERRGASTVRDVPKVPTKGRGG